MKNYNNTSSRSRRWRKEYRKLSERMERATRDGTIHHWSRIRKIKLFERLQKLAQRLSVPMKPTLIAALLTTGVIIKEPAVAMTTPINDRLDHSGSYLKPMSAYYDHAYIHPRTALVDERNKLIGDEMRNSIPSLNFLPKQAGAAKVPNNPLTTAMKAVAMDSNSDFGANYGIYSGTLNYKKVELGDPTDPPKAPSQPKLANAFLNKAGQLQVNGRPILSGQAEKNSTITLESNIDGVLATEVQVDENGNWSVQLSQSLTQGAHQIIAKASNETGISESSSSLSLLSTGFTTTNNVTSNVSGNLAMDDFVFGSDQLDDDSSANGDKDARFFFDKSKAAWRAGLVERDEWDDANVGDFSTVSGGEDNTASGTSSTVSGGYVNTASAPRSTVSGGRANRATESYSTVSGGVKNSASAPSSTVGGGDGNTASAPRSTVSGGEDNTASASFSTASGGYFNTASGTYSTVSGGGANEASNLFSTVSGGRSNTASAANSTVSGGTTNKASGSSSTVSGGGFNEASGSYSSISGGLGLEALSFGETIVGVNNETYTPSPSGGTSFVATDRLFVIGNGSNSTNKSNALVMLKNGNTTLNGELTITDGISPLAVINDDFVFGSDQLDNKAGTSDDARFFFDKSKGAWRAGIVDTDQWNVDSLGMYSTVAGGRNNKATGGISTISGGSFNNATGIQSTVGGGSRNQATGSYSTVSGGSRNQVTGSYSTVSGGFLNNAIDIRSTVGGGAFNNATGRLSTVGGGFANNATGSSSTVGGGEYNKATGRLSTIPGGYRLEVGCSF